MRHASNRFRHSRKLVVLVVILVSLMPLAASAARDPVLHLETPRRALEAFLNASGNADHDRAADVLDLRRLSPKERARQGPRLARGLRIVLDRGLWIDPEDVSDQPDGNPKDGPFTEELGSLELDGKNVPITMSLVKHGDGKREWVFSAQTVAEIPALEAEFANRWIDRLPQPLVDIYVLDLALWQWIALFGLALASVVIGSLLSWGAAHAVSHVVRRTPVQWDDKLFEATRGSLRVLTMALVFRLLLPALQLIPPAQAGCDRALVLILIGTLGWLLIRLVRFVTLILEGHAERRAGGFANDVRLRSVRTQMLVLRRVVDILIGVLVVALMLMQFEAVRNVGLSVLASAGVMGIVLGLAAQKPITALLAGLQMSVTQPIRIGDAVLVQNEFGTIEEIKLSHVIVKIWDERRLIVPTTYFLDNAFQNWTRGSAQLTGQVLIAADFALPVSAMRAELEVILAQEPLWDGRVKELAVTDATDSVIQIRALVSACDAGKLFNLRCIVRERLIAWLRDFEHGRYLPKRRLEGEELPDRGERRISSADVRAGSR